MHCYAIRQAWRLMHNPNPKIAKKFEGTVARDSKGKLNWTGRINFDDEVILKPFSWRLPRLVFVNSLSDLFHKNVKDEWLDRAFAVMAACPHHTFQVLTKEPERMLRYLSGEDVRENITTELALLSDVHGLEVVERAHNPLDAWPLPNVWLGTSCEDQKTADERIPQLLQTPASLRWISAEPLLGPVDLSAFMGVTPNVTGEREQRYSEIDWVVVGGESGSGARPLDLNWIKSIVQQCQAANVPAFVKQLGNRPWWDGVSTKAPPDHIYLEAGVVMSGKVGWQFDLMRDKKGGDWNEWPIDLRVREFPAGVTAK